MTAGCDDLYERGGRMSEKAKAEAAISEQKAAVEVHEDVSSPAGGGVSDKHSLSRRTLAIGIGSTAALLALGGLRYAGHNPLKRPPGGQDEAALVSACIRCQRCYEACPQHVIIPARIEDGLLGMRTPELDFSSNSPGELESLKYCDFCASSNGGVPRCVEVCPTQALLLDEGADASNTVIGVAQIDTSQCMAYRDTGCRFCYDACVKARGDKAAIYLNSTSTSPRPMVDASLCNGCGACESVCVSLQNGSIAANANRRAIVVVPQGA